MSNNDSLHRARDARQDEFYTQLPDIERELFHYKNHFRDKVVFCNCDDPEYSNFWHFFAVRFDVYGLKKLIATHYEIDKPSYMLSMERQGEGEPTVTRRDLQGNGDFRSAECVELLKVADIVVTNPPFSLFREYVAQLMEYKKKFVIIGNKNSITYKEIFPLLKSNQMWIGTKPMGGSLWFRTPEGFHKKSDKIVDGVKLTEVACCWYTNLDIQKRHETLRLHRRYNPQDYLTYDNYNAIEVSKVTDIPCDYIGVMGVPITFMDKYNPDQFEIVGLDRYVEDNPHYGHRFKINGEETYARILIRRKR